MLIAFLDTDKLVTVEGLVIRATPIIPDMKMAFFRCLNCSHTVQVEIDRPLTGKIDMEMINAGVGAERMTLRADLKREIIRMLDGRGSYTLDEGYEEERER